MKIWHVVQLMNVKDATLRSSQGPLPRKQMEAAGLLMFW